MTPAETGKKVAQTAHDYPFGSTVWHRSCGKRGIVVEFAIDAAGCCMVVVDFGAGSNWEKCVPVVLSRTRVIEDSGDGFLQETQN